MDAFEGDEFGRAFNVPPDGSRGADVFKRKAEAFDGEPAVIVEITQSFKDALPIYMATAGNATIVLAGMHVLQVFAEGVETGRDVFLFNVRVEGIAEYADLRMVDLFG